MITIYGMPSCPDCAAVEIQIENRTEEFQYIDIGAHVKYQKAFLRLRDADPAFDEAKAKGSIGIPCFVKEDGSITLVPEEVGLVSRNDGAACSLEDHANGRKGC